jgi:hypothetical protein
MLTNNLSLDEEEAVQTELMALQQGTVSSLCSILNHLLVNHSLTFASSVTNPGKRGNTALPPKRTYCGACIFGTRYAVLHSSAMSLTIVSVKSRRHEEESATERVAMLA